MRKLRPVLPSPAITHRQNGAATRQHIKAGPLNGQQDGLAQRKACQANGPELDLFAYGAASAERVTMASTRGLESKLSPTQTP